MMYIYLITLLFVLTENSVSHSSERKKNTLVELPENSNDTLVVILG